MRALRLLAPALVIAASAAPPAFAQLPGFPRPGAAASPSPSPEPAAVPEVEAPDSPRAAARAFVDLAMKRGNYAAAVKYLVLPPGEEPRGAELVRRLRAVLERYLDIRIDTLSPASEGNRQDGLPDGVETLGQIP